VRSRRERAGDGGAAVWRVTNSQTLFCLSVGYILHLQCHACMKRTEVVNCHAAAMPCSSYN
jgi:hypothetical protein